MKVIVSACLLGDNVKYNGKNNQRNDLIDFLKDYEVIKICPEVLGGLSIPRKPAEIIDKKVINSDGIDVTKEYELGALKVLELVKENNIQVAILKKNSPSCGSDYIYDGTFTHQLIRGDGRCSRILKNNGVTVLNEDNYKEFEW